MLNNLSVSEHSEAFLEAISQTLLWDVLYLVRNSELVTSCEIHFALTIVFHTLSDGTCTQYAKYVGTDYQNNFYFVSLSELLKVQSSSVP